MEQSPTWNGDQPLQTPVGQASRSNAQTAPLPVMGNLQDRLREVNQASNPILEAARPLLRALADMPAQMAPEGIALLRSSLEQEIKSFTQLCEQANLRRDHVLAVRYALCTALDEAASMTSWGGGSEGQTGPWSTHALLNTFHKETFGGKTVFLLIGRLANQPQEHMHVLEVMYQLLGLGFEGHYRTQSNGARMLEAIRHRLYSLIATSKEPVPAELSMHWMASTFERFKLLRQIPLWLVALVLGLILLAVYGWAKYVLSSQQGQVVEYIERIPKIKLAAPPKKKLRLKEVLATEIAQGSVNVDENGQQSKVTFRSDDMFVAGKATLDPRSDAVLLKIADAIKSVSGKVLVVGHSDNMPIKTREFPDNEALSLKRADAVAQVLQQNGVNATDIRTQGKGATVPVADNSSVAGRARNRRVEIEVIEP